MEANAKIIRRIHEHKLRNKNRDQNKQTRVDCKNINKEYKQQMKVLVPNCSCPQNP
jgi:predicted protein tyrosine phosphatase